jgi:hypothetical protein
MEPEALRELDKTVFEKLFGRVGRYNTLLMETVYQADGERAYLACEIPRYSADLNAASISSATLSSRPIAARGHRLTRRGSRTATRFIRGTPIPCLSPSSKRPCA